MNIDVGRLIFFPESIAKELFLIILPNIPYIFLTLNWSVTTNIPFLFLLHDSLINI